MPELPEVQTTIRGLKSKVLERAFVNVWSDWEKIIKKPKEFSQFKKELKDKKIKRIWRRGKNIIFDLSDDYSLLVHQKMTGHLLVGKWKLEGKNWKPINKGFLEEKINTFIHLVFFLDNGGMISLSDVRKFAKVELWKTKELLESREFKNLGPEPLDKDFTFKRFKEAILFKKGKTLRRAQGKVKQVLMDQGVIAGIGNIYSSEVLWWAKIHPEKDIAKLNEKELKLLYRAIKKVLELGIKLGGESFSDYRKPDGSKGDFDTERKAYRRDGQKCSRCKTKIKRMQIGGRSAFFCAYCQKL